MPKAMHKIVLFIEPYDDEFYTPEKIGHLFMNRFGVDEDAAFKVINVLELEKISSKMSWPKDLEYSNFENERIDKGMGRFIVIYIL